MYRFILGLKWAKLLFLNEKMSYFRQRAHNMGSQLPETGVRS